MRQPGNQWAHIAVSNYPERGAAWARPMAEAGARFQRRHTAKTRCAATRQLGACALSGASAPCVFVAAVLGGGGPDSVITADPIRSECAMYLRTPSLASGRRDLRAAIYCTRFLITRSPRPDGWRGVRSFASYSIPGGTVRARSFPRPTPDIPVFAIAAYLPATLETRSRSTDCVN